MNNNNINNMNKNFSESTLELLRKWRECLSLISQDDIQIKLISEQEAQGKRILENWSKARKVKKQNETT